MLPSGARVEIDRFCMFDIQETSSTDISWHVMTHKKNKKRTSIHLFTSGSYLGFLQLPRFLTFSRFISYPCLLSYEPNPNLCNFDSQQKSPGNSPCNSLFGGNPSLVLSPYNLAIANLPSGQLLYNCQQLGPSLPAL